MRHFLVATAAILVLALAGAAHARSVWLDYNDSATVEACDPYGGENAVYAMRMTPLADATPLDVWLRADGVGTLELHLWPDADGLPDTSRDLIEPFTFDTEDGQAPKVVELPDQTLTIAAGLSFFVGLARTSADGARLCMDATDNNALRAKHFISSEWRDNHKDWLVRVRVDYQNEPERFYFEDATAASGLVPGSRVAVADYDADGDLDVLFNGNALFANDGAGGFADVSASAGFAGLPSNGGLFADWDNDGDLDVFAMVNSLTEYDRFLQNNAGVYTDVTGAALVEADRDLWPTEGAGWGDYDGDGFLDLYLANYEMPGEELAFGTPDKLYRNNGDGTFTDVAASLGLDPETTAGDRLCGRGVNWGDFNDDGRPDIYVSNYRLDPNYLWVNDGAGGFADMAEELGVQGNFVFGAYGHTIGSAWGDFNNDGLFDLFNANLAHPRYASFSDPSFLFINNGPPTYDFANVSADWELLFVETHSDPSLGDFNNDGWIDLLITDVYENFWQQLYRNNGDGTLSEVSYFSGLDIENGWGALFADVDGDGWLDVVSNRGLFRNTLGTWDDHAGKRWLKVRLTCATGDPFCVGGRVTVQRTADVGPQVREIASGKGTTQGDDFTLHFGLNECATAWRVEARFPSGAVVTRYEIPADALIEIDESDASDVEPDTPLEDGACALVSYPEPEWPPGDDDVDDDTTDDDATDDDSGDDDLSDEASAESDDDDGCGC